MENIPSRWFLELTVLAKRKRDRVSRAGPVVSVEHSLVWVADSFERERPRLPKIGATLRFSGDPGGGSRQGWRS